MLKLLPIGERRSFQRAALPLEALVDGARLRLIDLSMGGFRLAGGGVAIDDVEDVLLRMRSDRLALDVQTTARCIFSDGATSGFEFVNLRPEQAFLLDALCAAAAGQKVEPGDSFLKYATRRADRAVAARYSVAPLAI